MGLRLNNPMETPPGQFQAVVENPPHPPTRIGPTHTYSDWMNRLKAHHKANNLPIGSQFEENYEDQLCKHLPPGYCNREGRDVGGYYAGRISFGMVKQGTETLLEWFFKAGKKKMTKVQADARATVCATCPMNVQTDCSSCAGSVLVGLANMIVGANGTSYDSHLHACSVCGCSLRAKVWLPLDTILNNTPPEQNEALPEYCWIKTEANGNP